MMLVNMEIVLILNLQKVVNKKPYLLRQWNKDNNIVKLFIHELQLYGGREI